MEFLIVLGILGLGYKLKSDEKKVNKKHFIENVNKSKKPSPDNVYSSNRAYDIFQGEQSKANILLKKSLYPQDTNIVTPGPPYPIMYNKVDYEQKSLPIEFNSYEKYDDIVIDTDKEDKTRMLQGNLSRNNMSLPESGGFQGISLTGDQINPNTFTHNNMQPFFGSNVKQNLDEFSTRGIFENFTGTADSYQKKQETGQLFQPQKNMSNVYGTGNLDGYMYDRYYVSNIRSSETPIEKVYVGPGLNQGYTNEPSGGFQQPDAQDYAMPKTVDELRVKTKPKISYYGRVVSGQKIAKPSKIGTVYKNRPDTFYIQEPDRYFTTTGQVIAEAQRPCQILKYTNRKTTELKTRTGSAAPVHGTVAQVRSKYKLSNKVTYINDGPRNADATGAWSIIDMITGKPSDYGKSSIRIRNNKRILNAENEKGQNIINFKGPIEKGTARSTQKLRTTKKIIKNNRPEGNLSGRPKGIAYDPNDVPRTTIKESNIHNNHSGMLQNTGASRGVAYDPNDIARTTIKETNIHNNHSGMLQNTGASRGVAYDPSDTARTTIKETNIHNNHSGMLQNTGSSRGIAYDPNDIARTTIKETNIHNNHSGMLQNTGSSRGVAYDPNDVARTTIKETNIHNNHSGMLQNTGASRGVVYDPNDVPKTTMKQTTSNNKRKANINNSGKGNYVKNTDKAKRTTKETTMAHNVMGIATEGRGDGYLVRGVQAPETIREKTSVEYEGIAQGSQLGAYEVTDATAPNTNRQFTSDTEYFGGAGNDGVNEKPMSYEDVYNAEIKAIRSEQDRGYMPNPGGVNEVISSDKLNLTTKKIGDIQNQYLNERGVQANKVYNSIPQMTNCNLTQEKEIVPNEPLANRINPDILDAFLENPYTQSLGSWA
jgi:hypothetical protein